MKKKKQQGEEKVPDRLVRVELFARFSSTKRKTFTLFQESGSLGVSEKRNFFFLSTSPQPSWTTSPRKRKKKRRQTSFLLLLLLIVVSPCPSASRKEDGSDPKRRHSRNFFLSSSRPGPEVQSFCLLLSSLSFFDPTKFSFLLLLDRGRRPAAVGNGSR